MSLASYIFRILGVFCLWLAVIPVSDAIIIDTFQTAGLLSSSTAVGTPHTLHIASNGALGGGRSFRAEKTGAGIGVSRIEVADGALGYTQGAHAGIASVTWDGDTDPDSVKYNGLGGVDLTQDGAIAFNLGLVFFDYPFNQSIQIVLRAYDASASNGTKFSEVALTLNQYFDGPGVFTIDLPFSLFATAGAGSVPAPVGQFFSTITTVGSGGPVDVRNIGALVLTFNGTSNGKAPDAIITPFSTNGRCDGVPNQAGRILDDCSVCLNDSNAGKGRDRCGVCFFGPTGYSYVANKVIDACGVCPSDSRYSFSDGMLDSCGTCLSGPPSYKYVDNTAVCDATKNNCRFVPPTKQIRAFEEQLVKKANILTNRFIADVQRFLDRKCPGSVEKADALVTTAYLAIKARAQDVFGKGVQVCGTSCVTVSFAKDVAALTPFFRVLERQVAATAQRVQSCYRTLGITRRPLTGGGRAGQTISGVRRDLEKLVKDCQKTKVCPKN